VREAIAPIIEPGLGAARELRGAAIGSAAMALPATVVPNAPIAERLGVDERWIETRTGIRERRMLRPDERLSDLAAAAGARALERAQLAPEELDLLLLATMSQDEVAPGAAPLVAGALGAANAAAFDIGAACNAFISGLDVASGQIESGRALNALVIGADCLARFLDPDDRRTAALFGDGAGAVVLTASAHTRIGPIRQRTESARDMILIERGSTLSMKGHETFVNAVARISEVTADVLADADLTVDDIDLFVYHQANARILTAVGERLALPPERVLRCIERYGNTSAASIPIALAEAEAEGRLTAGMRVLMSAFGAGFVWGAAIVEWGRDAA
jgi:3-oxoacyl-[acyl-carrier-protein] synthase III